VSGNEECTIDGMVRRARRPWSIALATLLLFVLPSVRSTTATPLTTVWSTSTRQLVVDGATRDYLVARPEVLPGRRLPVVVALHGRDMTPDTMRGMSGMEPAFGPAIFAYPRGEGLSWNAGSCCGFAHDAQVDDVSFLRAVVRDVLTTQADADPRSVFLVGYSNGGRMAYRMACSSGSDFRAVAAVEAVPVWTCRHLASPVSLLAIASSGDPLAPTPVLDQAVEAWAAVDGCAPASTPTTSGGLTIRRWTRCPDHRTVKEEIAAGGSHEWPSLEHHLPSAADEIAAFFHAAAAGAPDRGTISRTGATVARRAGTAQSPDQSNALTRAFAVVETGVDPVTSRFSGARSAN
jgi:polyhydroxybutyrate depolymerase